MKLNELSERIGEMNRTVAYGSECNALQDFIADCYTRLGTAPGSDDAEGLDVPDDMRDYWVDVANGVSDDYDEAGARRENS